MRKTSGKQRDSTWIVIRGLVVGIRQKFLCTILNLKRAISTIFARVAFVLDEEAREALLELLEMGGELLPITCQGRSYLLFNALECVNCLDQQKTLWVMGKRTGAKVRIEKYEFVPNRFSESSLFKIPETAAGEVLTVTGLKDPEDEFKTRVEQLGLAGLCFEEIWSSKA